MKPIKDLLTSVGIKWEDGLRECLKVSRDCMVEFGSSLCPSINENECYVLVLHYLNEVDKELVWLSRDDNFMYLGKNR